MPELMKLLSTKSTTRYLPPKGTAGLARSLVSGKSRVPLPPARTIPSTRSLMSMHLRAAGDPSPCSPALGQVASQTRPEGAAMPSVRWGYVEREAGDRERSMAKQIGPVPPGAAVGRDHNTNLKFPLRLS